MQSEIVMVPIAQVRGGLAQPTDDSWDSEVAEIVLAPRFGPETLAGLGDFSPVEIVFHFDPLPESESTSSARHPRGCADCPGRHLHPARQEPAQPHGCQHLSALVGGRHKAESARLDAVEGTPVLDIKPVMMEVLPRGKIKQPAWASELMKDYCS